MAPEPKLSFLERVKTVVLGGSRNLYDQSVFHKVSLIAFFAWVGLGSDGISSSCYGPSEAFSSLGHYMYLGVFVALATAITIAVVSTSYSQIIELFPSGGGGYLVASKLLSPELGVVSGCALLVDYVLTITVSVASGADAVFSFLPKDWHQYRLAFAVFCVVLLVVLNLRGVKESVITLVPIFMFFVVSHAFVIIYALADHFFAIPVVAQATVDQVRDASTAFGWAGMLLIIMRAFSLGAGTYTGIEAVSNGLPVLREPRVATGKRTLRYLALSLAVTVVGLIAAYLLYEVHLVPGKTLNAVLFERITSTWLYPWGTIFVTVTLVSEAAILFVAAQTGFLDGPRVLANMAVDHWAPTKFSTLSDRLVTKNGVLYMGGAAIILMLLTGGRVSFLLVLYAVNVFITFALSQSGMVRHWWQVRAQQPGWRRKLLINGVGFVVTFAVLVAVVTIKFHQGGWITLFITGSLVTIAFLIRRHYRHVNWLLRRLNILVDVAKSSPGAEEGKPAPVFDAKAKTAVVLVNGFNGVGLHTLFNIIRLFSGVYKNFVFIQIGIVDAGNFKGVQEVERLEAKVQEDLDQYVEYMKKQGYYAERQWAVGTDVVYEVAKLAATIQERFPQAVFFGGQLVFEEDPVFSRWLHNYTVFAVQKRFYLQGIPFIILPIRVQREGQAPNGGRRPPRGAADKHAGVAGTH